MDSAEKKKVGAFRRTVSSIRTRYSLMTAFFLLVSLAMVYVGGRIVLIHYIRDTEQQVRQMGVEISERAQVRSALARSGLEPMIDEAMNFYSGGYWTVREKTPKAFASTTSIAFGRLAFFIALCGLLFVIPLFWSQNYILLNPLSKMTKAIAALGARSDGRDCPRLEWEGHDEFAQLADSVNRMVETIAAKTVSLANSEASHQALIDGVPDGLVVFDVRGRMVSISKQPEGVGPLPGLFPGEPPSPAVFGEAESRHFVEAAVRTAERGLVSKVRLKVQRPLGLPKSVPTRHFELRLSRLGARFVLAIVRDVSAEVAEHKLRLAAEQRTLDTSKRESLTNLAAGIAHDMNNVLSVVLNAAEAEGADPSGDSVKTLETIRDAVRRGSSMMRELMTFAGENRMTLLRATAGLVLEDVRHLAAQLVGPNVELVIGSAEGTPDVDVDPNQFWKVLFNIVKNAAEAIGSRPGRIELSAIPFRMTAYDASNFTSEHPVPEGDGVLFRIDDDGPGIPPEILARIFDPYVSSKSVGRGLGLATVRTIVEAHGGGIRVESVPDRGTTFLVYLPASRLPKAEARAAAAPAAALSGDVLIVDNDEAILKTTAILLKALKLEAHVARDRREALATVRRYADRMRAIVLDAHLGGIDTVRLLDAFRVGAPKVPVIVSSGSAADEIEKMFRTHRYDAFLAKPYTVSELKAVIGRVSGKGGAS